MASLRIQGQNVEIKWADENKIEISGERAEKLYGMLQNIASDRAHLSELKDGRFTFDAEEMAMDAARPTVPQSAFHMVEQIIRTADRDRPASIAQ